MSKTVNVTLRLRLKTDPTDPVQLEADLAEVLQEFIEEGVLNEMADIDEEDEDEEEDYQGN